MPTPRRSSLPSRRSLLRGGLGAAALTALPGVARAGTVRSALVTGYKVKNLTGPAETGRFAAPWTDLGIPARCPDGSILFVCGDTFDGGGFGGPDWRAPVGLRSSSADLNNLTIDGAVGGSHANGLVP
jgi:hypothetical protein